MIKVCLSDDGSPESASFFQIGTEIEAGLCGLIVSDVLCCDADAVNRILQERPESVIGGYGRDVEPQGAVVLSTHQNLFPPVSQEVALQAGSAFRPVDTAAAVEDGDRIAFSALPIIFGNRIAVQQFTEQVAVPPDGHVDTELFRVFVDCFSLVITYAS